MTTTELAPPLTEPVPPPNPYVGPRAFRYGEVLFGRSSELAEVLDLLIAQRILLLYSPSGAGKTSLLEAGLRPALEANEFFVFSTARVSHELPPSLACLPIRNRYLLSTLLSLEEGRPSDQQLDPQELATIRLDDYLARFTDTTGRDPCLFIDQFEELFTLDPTDLDEKSAFLSELGEALRDRGRWALLAMREDFVAQLDPYLVLLPTLLRTRHRLDLLSSPAARAAMQQPAALAAVSFSDEAANRLVDDLRRVRVQRGSTVTQEPGPYVEPVQLQVVCWRLWSRLSGGDHSIGLSDVLALGDADNALADYYNEEVSKAAKQAEVPERAIRTWFDEELVSTQGFRTQVLQGPGGARSEAALALLENAHLIRADRRRGAKWYELAHDRLVEPVLRSNAAWRDAHLSTLQREAHLWDAQERPNGLLLTGDVLTDAETWASEHSSWLVPVEREYLEACREERRRVDVERRSARRTRRLAGVAAGVGTLAIAGLVVAMLMWQSANHQRERADKQAQAASWAYATSRSFTDLETYMTSVLYAFSSRPEGTASASLEPAIASIDHYLRVDPAYMTDTADMSPDGARLVRVADRGRVEVVELDGGERTTITTDPDKVLDVEFAPDSELLAVSSQQDDQPSLTLRPASKGGETLALDLPDGVSATALSFSTTPELLAAIGRSNPTDATGQLLLWELPSGRGLPAPAGFPTIRRLVLSPDGSTLAAVDFDGHLVLWRLEGTGWRDVSPDRLLSPASNGPIAFNVDASMVVVGREADSPIVLSLARDGVTETQALPSPDTADESAATAVVGAWFLDGSRLQTVTDDGMLEVWTRSEASYESESVEGLHGPWPLVVDLPLDFSDDGTRLLSLEPGYGASVLATGPDPRVILGYDVGEEPTDYFSANAETFAVGGKTYTMGPRYPEQTFAWATDPSEHYVLGGSDDGRVAVWDRLNGKEVARFELGLDMSIDGFVFGTDYVGVLASNRTELLVFKEADLLRRGPPPTPAAWLALFGSGTFVSVTFAEHGESIDLVEGDGSESTLVVRPDYAKMAADDLILAEEHGLALSDEECRRLVGAACPSP